MKEKEEQEFMNIYNSEAVRTWTNNYINYILLKNEILKIKENKNNKMEQFISNSFPNDEVKNIIEIQNINTNVNDNNDINKNKDNKNNMNDENKIKIDSSEMEFDENNLSKKADDVSMSSEEISLKINIISENDQNQIEKSFKNQINNFISLLDKEINKIHIFFTTKEKDLFEMINSQIVKTKNLKRNKENFDEKKLLKIIDSLEYISNLSKELINYVYLNIKALKRILYLFDTQLNDKTESFSYLYLKRYLSKQNSELTYILTFKILDETCLATESLLLDLKNIIISQKNFNGPSNEKIKTDFYDYERNILNNISEINIIRDKIFSNLTEWQNYLNVSLKLPSSANKSIFKNTSFTGDSIPKEIKKSNSNFENYEKNLKNDENEKDKINNDKNNNDYKFKLNHSIIKELEKVSKNKEFENEKINIITDMSESSENEIEKEDISFINNNNLLPIENSSKDQNNRKSFPRISIGFSLFDPSETFSFKPRKSYSKNSKKNFILLLPLSGFYSYSYSIIIPKIIFLIYNEEKLNEIYFYALAISIPSFGNLISKIYIPKLSEKHYKRTLIMSLFFIFICYILLIIGFNERNIIYILIGRFILGLSYLKQLSKSYVDNYVPITNQIKSNHYYTLSTSIGFLFGFCINVINISDEIKINLFYEISGNNLIIFISEIIFLIMVFLALIFFKEPYKENFDEFNDNAKIQPSSKEITINKKEKLISENSEKENINNINNINDSELSELDSYVSNIEKTKKFYFKKLYTILLVLLIANQYSSENLLLLISRIYYFGLVDTKDDEYNYNDNLFVALVISIVFLLSYFIQAKFLEKYFIKTNGRCLLMVLSFFILLFHAFLGYLVLPGYFPKFNESDEILFTTKNEFFQIYLPLIGIILLIIFTELFHSITVNMFIELLPLEDLKFCCFKMSTFITIITKLSRIAPSCIIILIKSIDKDIHSFLLGKKFAEHNNKSKPYNFCNLVLFGLQSLNYIICFILCLCCSKLLKRSFMNRVFSK